LQKTHNNTAFVYSEYVLNLLFYNEIKQFLTPNMTRRDVFLAIDQ